VTPIAPQSIAGKRLLIWSLLAVGAVVLPLVATFASMVAIWNRDSTFTHGYIIPLLSAWLLWRDRRGLLAVDIKPAPLAWWPIAALLALWMLADLSDVQVVRQGVAVALIPCALWLVLGTAFARRALFPLLYLLFAVPFGDFLVPYLVEFTTHFTVAAVQLVGVPIYREGTLFSLPSGNFEVIKACSGVRYLIATIALGTLFAALSYTSWRRRVAFMAMCLVLPVIANGVRAFGIVMIAHLSELRYAVGVDHFIYGWVFFGFVIWLLFWLGAKFSDRREPAAIEHVGEHRYSPVLLSALWLVLLGAVGALYGWRATASDSLADAPQQLIGRPGHWDGPLPVEAVWQPAYARSAETLRGRYAAASGTVYVYARRYRRQVEGSNEATSAPLIGDDQSDLRFDAQTRLVTTRGHVISAAVVAGRSGERWRVWRWYVTDNKLARSAAAAKLYELRAWLQHRRPTMTVICAVVALHDARVGTVSAADAVLEDFVAAADWQLLASATSER